MTPEVVTMADGRVEVERGEHGWVARLDGRVAGELVARDSRDGATLVLVHTEVDPAFEGHGVGGALVRAAVDAAVAAGRPVRPSCPFAAEWLRRHPDHPVEVQEPRE